MMFALTVIVAVELSLQVSGQGLTFSLRGSTIAAGSDVVITDIGEGTNALICRTDLTGCCASVDGNRQGEWILPDGTLPRDNADFTRTRGTGQVILSRANNAMGPLGSYCCDVPTMADPNSIACINTMSPSSQAVTVEGSGTLIAGQSYTLTCSGITNMQYQWRKDGTDLTGETSRTLTLSSLEAADTGGYTCTVTGNSTSETSPIFGMNVGVLSASVIQSGTPAEGSPYTLTCMVSGHQSMLTYEWFRNSVRLSQTSSRFTFNVINRANSGTYTCRATISPGIMVQGSTNLQVTVPPPGQPSRVRATSRRSTSVTVAWDAPSSGGTVDSYTVQYSASVRGCNVQPQNGRLTSILSTQRSREITGLEENSDVNVTVIAVNTNTTTSAPVHMTTTTIANPDMVRNLQSTSTITTVTLRWSPLSCVETNGAITGYRVEYGTTTSFGTVQTVTGTSFTATRLLPLTFYMFRVAAMNGNLIGAFSTTHTSRTTLPSEVTLFYQDALVFNQSIVNQDQITGNSNLFCITNFDTGSSRVGSWFLPNGIEVPVSSTRSGFTTIRGRSYAALSYSGSGSPPSGLYRCVIPQSSFNGQNVILFAGIYPSGEGQLSIGSIKYNFAASTLTCTSSGGPATTVTWRRNGATISQSIATQQQLVTNTSTATYHNQLIINSGNIRDYTGTFTCTVSNSRGPSNTLSQDIDAIEITGNEIFQLNETTNIRCSTPDSVSAQFIRWRNVSSAAIVSSFFSLNIFIVPSSMNTIYTCEILDGGGRIESHTITIQVGTENSPRVPEEIGALSTSNSITITWSFIIMLGFKNEVFTVMYGTTPGNLNKTSDVIQGTATRLSYSVNLVSLRPATTYYYQIRSTNSFESLDSPTFSIKTMDARSTAVTNVVTDIPDSTTLVLNWAPPISTNGDLLAYTVGITGGNTMIMENITRTEFNFTASSLSAGVPYNVSIIPVNLAGQGEYISTTYFTLELTPNAAVMDVVVERTSPTTMDVSWRPLTLSEARGFVTFYSIAYTPTPNSRRRQASQDTVYVNTSADSSSVTIQGLDGDLAYSVTVTASTIAGTGPESGNVVVNIVTLTSDTSDQTSDNTAVIVGGVVGGVVAVIFILAITAIIITVIVVQAVVRGRQSKTPQERDSAPAKEHENIEQLHIYNTIDGPEYEVVGCDTKDVKGIKEEQFVLNECPAYLPTGGRKGTDSNYETVAQL